MNMRCNIIHDFKNTRNNSVSHIFFHLRTRTNSCTLKLKKDRSKQRAVFLGKRKKNFHNLDSSNTELLAISSSPIEVL